MALLLMVLIVALASGAVGGAVTWRFCRRSDNSHAWSGGYDAGYDAGYIDGKNHNGTDRTSYDVGFLAGQMSTAQRVRELIPRFEEGS